MSAVATGPVLFSAQELGDWLGLGRPTAAGKTAVAERVVWGWLKPVLGADKRPQPVPEEVFSWAIELGAIAHENPDGKSSEELGPARRAFSSERRQEILDLATSGGSTTAALTPQGSFPPASRYPDPAVC